MNSFPKDLLEYANVVSAKYPEVSKKMALDILNNIPSKIDTKEYELAFMVEQKLGLSSGYFSKAYRRKIDIKAEIVKQQNFIYVKLDCELKQLLAEGYICCKIYAGERDNFDKSILFTKNTLLGFYK